MQNQFKIYVFIFLTFALSFKLSAQKYANIEQDRSVFFNWAKSQKFAPHGNYVDLPESNMSISLLAEYFAPILSFSQDEQYLPRALPFEKHAYNNDKSEIFTVDQFDSTLKVIKPDFQVLHERSVIEYDVIVYYRFNFLILWDKKQKPIMQENRINLEGVKKLGLQYLLYFRGEDGIGSHPNDIESIEYILKFDKDKPKRIYIEKAICRAHGSVWYDNVLMLQDIREIRLPLTILVEEGKHATCPDRNSDGYYTPGFDVNVRVNDAWGIRDNMRTRVFTSSVFKGWMAKVRQPKYRFFPPYYLSDLKTTNELNCEDSSSYDKEPEKYTYCLRPWLDPRYLIPSVENTDKRKEFIKSWSGEERKKGVKDRFLLASQLSPDRKFPWKNVDTLLTKSSANVRWTDRFGLSYRYDGVNSVAIALPVVFEPPLVKGWVVPRMFLGRKKGRNIFGGSLLYTPAASQLARWYFAAGAKRPVERKIYSIKFRDKEWRIRDTEILLEVGIKFTASFIQQNLQHVKIGLQTDSNIDGKIDKLKFVFELGIGPW